MSDAALAPPSIEEQAALWVVTLDEDPADQAARTACAQWCAEDPRHARALETMRRMWQSVTPQTPVPAPERRPTRRRASRHALGLLVVLPCLLWLGSALPWRIWLADERSAVGEVRQITLADGSLVTLNSDSAIDIDLSGDKRRLRLRRGEVYVEVAKGSAPFVVIDRDGSARALGTRYAVRRDAEDTLVTVTESRVLVRPRAAPEQATEVAAGEQVRFDRNGITQSTRSVAPGALAWRQGRVVFQDAPVAEVLRELARYRPGLLLADDQALAGLRFTGVLPARQSDEALALLAAALPIEVSRLSPWLVRVSAPAAR
ncbi:FecR family protein [Variovorax saccharolyticus]|uniref:FecR family protein n=1 Tax=Variovorax saccharolyticus TaxID=3053516 RepID=UPI00257647AD|nr:FecR family protein [Variovorax sp. J22R187]MDM0021658.1 FecR family protein [Variovorax sp. J22R187]